MLCVGRAIEFREEVFTEWKVLNLGRHTLPYWVAEYLGLVREESLCSDQCLGERCFRRPDRGSEPRAILDELFTAVEPADFS